MKKGIAVFVFVFVAALLLVSVSRTSAQKTTNDFKVRYKTSVGSGGAGTTGETITMIKGARERSETVMGGMGSYSFTQVNITQCDLKRTIQISDRAKKYVITPMETGEPIAATTPNKQVPASTTPARTGGVVNYITSNVDTGERKQMFGFNARHIKSSITTDASPNSCNPGKRRIDRDGWYIDLSVEFSCNTDRPATMQNPRQPGTPCRDKVVYKNEGTAKLGYPLVETVTIYGDNGQVMVTQTKEVVELSRATLDPALFDIPAGYTEAADSSELYAMPSVASMMGEMTQGQQTPSASSTGMPSVPTSATGTRKPGSVVVGVAQFNNKANKSISLDALRQRLIGSITGAGIEAIALNATSQMEAEAEAKVKQCDFILYTDLATLKTNKLGGMLGGITGTGSGLAKTEAKLDYRLFAVGESAPKLQSSASAKEEGEDNSAGTAADAEARAVVAEVKKRKG